MLVLLHDLGAHASSLAATADALAARGLRVLVPDLPGHGGTEARLPRGRRDFAELVEALFEDDADERATASGAGTDADASVSDLPRFVGGLGWGASAALNVAAGPAGDGLAGVVLIEPLLAELPALLHPPVRARLGRARRIEAAEGVLGRWRLDWLLDGMTVRVPGVTGAGGRPAVLPYRLYRPFSRGPGGLGRTFWCENPVLAVLPRHSDRLDVDRAATQYAALGTGFAVRHADGDAVAGEIGDWVDGILANPSRPAPRPEYPPALPYHPSHRKPTWIG